MYKKSLFNEGCPIRYEKGRLMEDIYTTHRLYLKAKCIMYVDAAMYCYRRRANSITTTSLSEKAALDEMQGMTQFISDLALAGQLDQPKIDYYRQYLNGIKERLEESNLQKTKVYQEILFRLSL